MKIQVLLFAQLKEAYGRASLTLELPPRSNIGAAVARVMEKTELRSLKQLPLRYAVNEEFRSVDTVLRSGDRLALLSPVAGG